MQQFKTNTNISTNNLYYSSTVKWTGKLGDRTEVKGSKCPGAETNPGLSLFLNVKFTISPKRFREFKGYRNQDVTVISSSFR